jgi:hypothetical protein
MVVLVLVVFQGQRYRTVAGTGGSRIVITRVVIFVFFSTGCSNNLKVTDHTAGGSYLGLLVGEAYGALVC